MFDYFYGYNLKFSTDQDYELQNVLNQLDTLELEGMVIDSSLLISQYSKEWMNKIASLNQINQAYTIYIIGISNNQLLIQNTLYIPQQLNQVICNEITFLDNEQILVNCFNSLAGQFNYFFYVSQIHDQFSWHILPYTPSTLQYQVQLFDLQVAFEKENNLLITLGRYNQETLSGVIEIYSYTQLRNQQTQNPIQIFNQTQYRQYKISNQLIYLMNATNVINVYSLINFTQTELYNISSLIQANYELLAFDVEPYGEDLLIYTTLNGENLFEITTTDIIRGYIVRIDFEQTSIPQLFSNHELITLYIDDQYYVYDRIQPNIIINTQIQNVIGLNQLPYNILTYTTNTLYYYQILQPQLFIDSTTNSNIVLQATSSEQSIEINCSVTINVTIHGLVPGLYQYEKNLPQQIIVKTDKIYLNVLSYVSGPLITISAQSSKESINIYDPSVQVQLSKQIWDQINGVFSFYSADFQSYAMFILQYQYVKEIIRYSQISLKLCDVNLLEYIDLEEMECRDYSQIFELNAPINKLQFTDLTNPDEVYFVADIAYSAVLIYKLNQFNAFTLVQAEFLCEPLPIDDQDYFHSITDFYVIGNYLYFILARIQQIWIYDIQTCTLVFKLTNSFFDTGFFPASLAGKTIVDENNKLRQIIFINSLQYVYVMEMVNKIPIYQNTITLDQYTNIKSLSIVKDSIILVVQEKIGSTSMYQYFYSIDQPTNEIKFIKKLPQYGVSINNKFIVASDDSLFYILMNNNFYYVYNPTLSSQDCLIQKLNYIGDYISATHIPNILKQSNVMIASHTNVAIYSVTNPTYLLVEQSDPLNSVQKEQVKYLVEVQSQISNSNIQIEGSFIAYDTLFVGFANQTLFLENNQIDEVIILDSPQFSFDFNLEGTIQNNVVSYSAAPPFIDGYPQFLCLVRQPFSYEYAIQSTPKDITQFTFTPQLPQVYAQNIGALYQVLNQEFVQLMSYNDQFTHCWALFYYSQQQQIISLCSQYSDYTFTVFNQAQLLHQQYQAINKFYFPLKMEYYSNFVSTLAIKQGDRSYSILIGNLSNANFYQNIQLQCQIQSADQISSQEVGDFTATQINGMFLFIYVCPLLQQIQYATISSTGNTILNQSIMHIQTELPKKATLQEIKLIQFEGQQINFLVTTKEFYSIILQANYSFQNEYIVLTNINSNKQVAPMQQSYQLKNTLYFNNFLFSTYHDTNIDTYLLALYDLGNLNSNIYYSIDTLRFKSPITYTVQGVYNTVLVMDTVPVLYSYNYTNRVGLQIENMQQTFYQQNLYLNIIQKYGPAQSVLLVFYFPLIGYTENWVKYTCIGVGSLYVIILITIIAVYGHKKRKQPSEDMQALELNLR
ncbi:unnamed protein product (macronuclear) [Paramecium tetraurelia]|uniref:Transmembrane protein n=1 Tax=Paramecium tetraurelia TaxID=5888 RepID=A0CUY4_PARTE|nr:uncharacterized protein GSPATT00010769001 [Paramecium tetraurelia]CAK74601.1 unnamed protein product [Paramecium tetraurelia]|eukprot:XP_001441998.1 hypothetical protein (macronuclear) [Paramecium tetraurelia strain d4-2]